MVSRYPTPVRSLLTTIEIKSTDLTCKTTTNRHRDNHACIAEDASTAGHPVRPSERLADHGASSAIG